MKINHWTILADIGKASAAAGLKAWVVGGFVRDLYLHKKTFDIDVCVEGPTKKLIDFCVKKYNAEVTHFNDFGTARVYLKNGLKLDFVTCRSEVYTKPAALPKVKPSTLMDDLYRRDFTANAWALSILPGEFFKSYDLFESKLSIDRKVVKILHTQSFIDDPTRIFRALRFAARFNWALEKNTKVLLKAAVKEGIINLLSRDRVKQEFFKILEEKNPLPVFKLLQQYKVTPFIYPGLKASASLIKESSLEGRVTLMALALGIKGGDFLKSLNLPRALHQHAKEILDIYYAKENPLKDVQPQQKRIIKKFNPAYPSYKFKRCFVTGGDVAALGFKGKDISVALSKVARLQRLGRIKTKKQALKIISTP